MACVLAFSASPRRAKYASPGYMDNLISSASNGKGKEKEIDSHSNSRAQVTEIVNVNLLSLHWKFKSRKSSDDRDKVPYTLSQAW